MIDPYQLWGIRRTRLAIVKLDAYPSLARLKRAWKRTLEQGIATSLEARSYFNDDDFVVINKEMPNVELREFNTSIQRDSNIIANAEYFTIVCFRGVGVYDRKQRKTLQKARQLAKALAKETKRKYMIYAVNSKGNSAFVETIR